MEPRKLNMYRLSYKDGQVDSVGAQSMIDALRVADETESPVVQAFMLSEGIDVAPTPLEVLLRVDVAEADTGAASPATAQVHEGDRITLTAYPAAGYVFSGWKINGEIVSNESTWLFTVPELLPGEDTLVVTAVFVLDKIGWNTEVSPAEAAAAGCIAFPSSGLTEAGGDISCIASDGTGWSFDHWEVDGQMLSGERILNTEAPLSGTPTYTAVFTED